MELPVSLIQLIDEFSKLPGIGRKTAKRLAFSLLQRSEEDSEALARAIVNAKEKIHYCSTCFGFSEDTTCSICSSARRDHSLLCIVEDPKNIFTIENSGVFTGVYHVLHGAISPMQGIYPDMLKIDELTARIEKQSIDELILATNPTIEGEATAHFLTDMFKDKVAVITRIARGIPSGSDMEFADSNTLSRAFEGRTAF